MMLYKLNRVLVVAFSSILLVSCGGGNSKSSSADEDKIAQTINSEIDKKLTELESQNNIPVYPEDSKKDLTIVGIDENANGIRDEVEQLIFQKILVEHTSPINTDTYNQILAIAKMLHPNDPPESSSIDKVEIFCEHNKLPDVYKEIVTLNYLYYLVHNTVERKNAYKDSLTTSEFSSGNALCN